jgi:hypothetical protein
MSGLMKVGIKAKWYVLYRPIQLWMWKTKNNIKKKEEAGWGDKRG